MQCALLKALGGERRLREAWEVYTGCSDKPACLRNTMMDVCIGSGDMRTAERILAEAQADNVADVITFNTIIKAYLKTGDTKRARSAMDAMRAFGLQPNVVTFNELIDATLRNSRREDLWVLIDEMHACGLQPNQVTCSILLKSIQPYSRQADVERTLAILDRTSDRMDEVLLSSACEACIRANRCDLVQRLLRRRRCDGVKVNGAHTFGSIIRAHGYVGDLAGVWNTWHEMRARGIRPTSITTGCMVEALVTNDGPEAGYDLIRDMLQEKESRPLINSVIYNSVLKGFAHHKRFFRVWEVYQEMLKEKLQLSIVTYNTLVDACAKNCEMSRVQGLMEEMARFNIEPNIVTYSTILKGYVQENNLEKAFQLLQEMKQTKEFQPDEIAYNTLLDGCARQGHMEKGLGLLADMQAVGVPPSNFTLSVLVKLANRSHQVDKAFALCEELSQKYSLRLNIHVYNNLMQACTECKDMPRALSVLEKLVKERVRPDARTYSILLRGCINSGDPQGAAGLMAAAFGLRKPLPPVADASSLQVRGGLPNELVLETLLKIAKQCKADQIAAGLVKDLRTIPGLKLDSKALLRVASPSFSS
jgi:pentatricopeptide repeat protein